MTETEQKAIYIADQCRRAGMTLAGAAGVLANVEAESAFIPTNVQDAYESAVGSDSAYTAKVDSGSYQNFAGDSAGYGLAQWTAADRKKALLQYCRERGASIGDFKTQVDFLIYEMSLYRRAWTTCTISDSPYQCGYDVCKYYEIPANTEASAQYRGVQAQDKWYPFLLAHQSEEITIPEDPAATGPGENQSGSEAPATGESTGGKAGKVKLRTIDQGIEGWPEVWLLQSALKERAYNVLIDGIFTASLTEKVKQFQRAAGLDADGVVGPLTWAAVLNFQ